MATELHLTIRAETAADALSELAQLGRRAAHELGAVPTQADPPQPELPVEAPKSNGADEAPPAARRGRRRATAEPDPAIDRDAVLKGLTDIYMAAEPAVREKIVAFRDGHGVQRLKDLKDDALPGAAALLTELQNETAGP